MSAYKFRISRFRTPSRGTRRAAAEESALEHKYGPASTRKNVQQTLQIIYSSRYIRRQRKIHTEYYTNTFAHNRGKGFFVLLHPVRVFLRVSFVPNRNNVVCTVLLSKYL